MRRTRSWIIPLVVAASFAVSGIAWAEGRYRKIEAFFESIDFRINGQTTKVDKESLIYNGSIYVPLRTVSELLGAEPFWDATTRTVSLEFVGNDADMLGSAVEYGFYQYISMEHNRIVASLAQHLRAGDAAGIRADIEGWGRLRDIALDLKDERAADSFDKLMVAADVLRTGWANKNFEQYTVAWELLRSAYAELRGHLTEKLSEQ
ncbi:copper amine oxidase N-terminal domain-containing protein [Paenibacillus sp.]|uniref:copper amine oxidase N-terminal domain-containing protein n=1 Tax=Paenibacillus sp. TaxID=58172 RepID=UPI002D2266B5|nr:copper amine oxidase N-terminal domain-containing protein [Paenibacillus sp.]HZG88497.1 copper amine oxidase N-terminal domain-containing protein [Paenibacillus sp.]